MTETRPPNFRTSVINIDRPGDASIFGDDVRAAAAEIIARYPAGQARSALLPMLHLVQSEQGYVTADGVAFCAEVLDLTKAQVAAVVTFYTMFKRRPTGEFLVSVCRNPLCGLLGGDDIYAALSESLGIGMNETTADGTITLEHAECLAACDYAPVLTVNYEFFDQQTVASAMSLVQDLRSGQRPLPTRGAPLSTFREIERLIAGFPDPRSDALEFEASGAPTEAGVRLAVDRGESAPSYATRDQDDRSSAPPPPATGQQQTSEHDAPLSTAESDPDHPAQPAGQKEG